jgi:cytochrome c-type biogenesis protein
MFPVYVMYLTGNPEEAGGGKRLTVNTLGFVLGFSIIFVLLGATATWLGSFISGNKLILQRVSGAVIVLFGLNFAGIIRIPFLDRERRFQANTAKLGFFTSLLFGAAFSFGWSPCLGVFLGSAFMLAANSNTVGEGMLMLLLFSLGLGIPFFICTIIIDRLKNIFSFIKKHYRVITVASGMLLVVAGLALLFDVFGYWAGFIDSLFP